MEVVFDTNGNTKQREVAILWNDTTTFDIVYGGSKGSGKSFLGCSLILSYALMYPETHYFIARKTGSDLRKFTIPSIHEVLGLWNIHDKMYKFNGQDNFFKFKNDSKIFLLDAKPTPSDPTYARFGSMQMTRGWIEEAGEFEVEAKNNLAASIGRWKNKEYNITGKLLQTCNPAKNYLYKDYYKPHKEGRLAPHLKFVQALPSDNKMLPQGYLENLNLILSPSEKERLLYGNWEYDDDPSVLIDYEAITDLFSNKFIAKNASAKHYITFDVARYGRDSSVIMVWKDWEVIECIEIKHNDIPSLAKKVDTLAKKYRVPASRIIGDEDGVGGGCVDILKCKGFTSNARPIETDSVKSIDGTVENYANLKSQCYFKLADKINNREMFFNAPVDTSITKRLSEDLEQVKQVNMDSDGKKRVIPKEDVKKLLGRSPDFSDALMMRMYFTLKKERAWFTI